MHHKHDSETAILLPPSLRCVLVAIFVADSLLHDPMPVCVQAINEKPNVIQDYESGRAIPNPQIISKIERALGVHLPRGGAKKKKAAATTA